MFTTRTEKLLIVLSVLGAFLLLFDDWGWGCIVLGIVCLLMYLSAKQISAANPPQVGIPTRWGRRIEQVIQSRWVFVFNYFPLMEDILLEDVSKIEEEIVIEGVRCRAAEPGDNTNVGSEGAQSGGKVRVKVGVTFEPSQDPPENMLDYIVAGGRDNVLAILKNIVAGAVREEGSTHTWERLTFTKAELSAKFIAQVTGKQPKHRVIRGTGGHPLRDASDSDQAYKLEPVGEDEKLDEVDYQAFLQHIVKNGENDVLKLGIRIRRLNVVEIEPEGELDADAEGVARETQQRRTEQMDFETERMLIRSYMDDANKGLTPGSPGYVSYEKAAQWVQVNRKRVQKVVVESSGNQFADAAALLRTPTAT